VIAGGLASAQTRHPPDGANVKLRLGEFTFDLDTRLL